MQTFRYFDDFANPETTGYYKSVDGLAEFHVFALTPAKYCLKFVRSADGSKWECTNANGETAEAAPEGCAPLPSFLGAGCVQCFST